MQECYTDIHSIINGNLIWTGGKTNFKKKRRRRPTTDRTTPTTQEQWGPHADLQFKFSKCPPIRQVREIQIVQYLLLRIQTPCVRCIFRPRPLTNIPCVRCLLVAPPPFGINSKNFRPNCVASPRCVLKRSENRTVSRPLEHGTLFWILGPSPRVPFLV